MNRRALVRYVGAGVCLDIPPLGCAGNRRRYYYQAPTPDGQRS